MITGAAGFIGSHLCERLLEQGDRVVGYDNFDPYYEEELKEANIREVLSNPGFKLVRGDILDLSSVYRLFQEFEPDKLVHLAAKAGVRPSLEDPAGYQRVNVEGLTNVLQAAHRIGVNQLVLASSSSVYGANTKIPFNEDDPVNHPISPYAASKRAGELIAAVYHHLYGMHIASLRFFTVYGPRQRPDMAIAKFCRRAMDGVPIEMYGDGATQRDYTFIDDIIDGVVASLDRVGDFGFEIINLGNSQTVSLAYLIETIYKALDISPNIIRRPMQPGDVEITYADVSKAARLLGYHPHTSIEHGLAKYVEWLKGTPPGGRQR